jgi:CRISPR/Cas system-associated exonuclease Cas4 (RecB family)
MKIIRASEIGSYSFCQRAWWYRLQGYESENQAELAGGSEYHDSHGRTVVTAGCFTTLAYGLLILAVAVLTIWLVGCIT